MKTITTAALCLSSLALLAAASALVARAEDLKSASRDKAFSGKILTVASEDRVVKAKWFLFPKSFHLGERCKILRGDRTEANIKELRPGQRVRVIYQDVGGVLVASRLRQVPMTAVGRLEQVDPEQHTLTLRKTRAVTVFTIADDCKVTLAGGKEGRLDTLKPGSRILVQYESPADGMVACRIEQRGEIFTGNLTAVDGQTRTVKAKHLLNDKSFVLANNCRILVEGKTDAPLSDLRLGKRLTFTFEEVDGVNVVSSIAGPEAATDTETDSAANTN
jgi:hypothetical protein